ncbi:DUF7000 family protein [Stutzerimonas kirkiae]|uniref:DUF7000 family protein n=1 Tax=Stutzerimonas kirkiae TaxID=2211392 RepID=UPI0010383EB7|nr:hypothetical protein [Stutzerimonas kirkiae]TBV11917.1 hypothetical protein DNK01_15835 [Stutzerimonas kirkiae]
MKNINDYIATYKMQLQQGDVREAYEYLVKYVMRLRAHFSKNLSAKFSFGNVSPGYMDFTYFPFFDDFLRERGLRFGIVLNHQSVRFELWLMGQNAEIQKKYWDALRSSKWNKNRLEMPKYFILESVLVESPDFQMQDSLIEEIEKKSTQISSEVISHIKYLEKSINA